MGMVSDMWHVSVTCHMSRFLLTFDPIELQKSVLHVNWSKFHQEFNGHGPRHVTRICHASRVMWKVFANFRLDWATVKCFTCKMVTYFVRAQGCRGKLNQRVSYGRCRFSKTAWQKWFLTMILISEHHLEASGWPISSRNLQTEMEDRGSLDVEDDNLEQRLLDESCS